MAKSPYSGIFSKKTPQGQRAPGDVGKRQVKNRAGGYVFKTEDWDRLDRFLILGSAAPTYYATGRELTTENAQLVVKLLDVDGRRVVDRIVEISDSGRAPRNSPALYALALAISFGDTEVRRHASDSLLGVARTASHLFEWLSYVKEMRGFGKVVKRAVNNWYNSRGTQSLAYQMLKYQNRYGWTHWDVIKMMRPDPATDSHSNLYAWAIGKEVELDTLPDQIGVVAELHDPDTPELNERYLNELIVEHRLTREMIPTHYLNSAATWDALLQDMPIWALIRNLGKMTEVGLIRPGSDARKRVVERLTNTEYIRRGRVHPLTILQALATYRQGHGVRGSLTWATDGRVLDALDEAFYIAFGNIEPIGNRILLALDVSASMTWHPISGLAPVYPREGSAAMALVTARTERAWEVIAFDAHTSTIPITPRQRLDDVVNLIRNLPARSTDCSLPMLYALQNGMSIDTFVIYTDNETWYGNVHPFQALNHYRQKTGIPAKLAVVGMTATGFSIADPESDYMLDVVGFDTAAPNIIADFARG